jgi:hypothetical protein
MCCHSISVLYSAGEIEESVMPEWRPYRDEFNSFIFPERKLDVRFGKY